MERRAVTSVPHGTRWTSPSCYSTFVFGQIS